MVKVFATLFASLLVWAHVADLQGDAYQRPLSMFRDYEPAWIGYALFGLLLAVGLGTVRTSFRVEEELHAAVYLATTFLLAFVAATPSNDSLHLMCALTVMVAMFVYYAVLLYRRHSMFWLVMHLLSPSVLMMASRLESYGIWQKCLIVYFLVAAVAHENLLAQWLPKRVRRKTKRVQIRVGRKYTGPGSSVLSS
jgi:hypothetical protein